MLSAEYIGQMKGGSNGLADPGNVGPARAAERPNPV